MRIWGMLTNFRDGFQYRKMKVKVQKVNRIAVILHLYYVDMYDYMMDNLGTLSEDYDLYVTMPNQFRQKVPTSLLGRKNTTLLFLPNRGRDVRPFLMAARLIKDLKYDAILKLQTKKSPHFDGGQVWLDDMVKALTRTSVKDIVAVLRHQSTIVGPKGYYMSLEVNYEANGTRLDKILAKAGLPKSIVRNVTQEERGQHGFFSGSMFWISQDLLKNSAFYWSAMFYEPERGQIDGTLAHAMERAFTIIPEANGIPIFETDGRNIYNISYDTGIIPEWSDKYTKQ